MKLFLRLILLTCLTFLTHIAIAQPASPFSVSTYGNFSQMMKVGQAPGRVLLQPMAAQKHLYGLGALQSLQGEITIIDSKILVSHGNADDGHTAEVTAKDSATLLAIATVNNWVPLSIPHAMSSTEFEQFLIQSAKQSGVSLQHAFPFMVKGEIKNLHWHVVSGLQPPANGTKAHAEKHMFTAANVDGTLLGFYTGKQLAGIISHEGELFHIHFIDKDATHAGHVDSYAIGAHAILFLPQQSLN